MRDPYLYDDVNVLKNLAGIKDAELLRKAEADITEDLVTLMWANEQFDPNHPDTYFEKV